MLAVRSGFRAVIGLDVRVAALDRVAADLRIVVAIGTDFSGERMRGPALLLGRGSGDEQQQFRAALQTQGREPGMRCEPEQSLLERSRDGITHARMVRVIPQRSQTAD